VAHRVVVSHVGEVLAHGDVVPHLGNFWLKGTVA